MNQIDRNKLWIKMVFEKKRGGFTKLVEAVSVIGYEFTDTSVTTSSGAILVTACLEVRFKYTFALSNTKIESSKRKL